MQVTIDHLLEEVRPELSADDMIPRFQSVGSWVRVLLCSNPFSSLEDRDV